MELAYTKGIVPARALLDTTAPVLVWNAQKIRRLDEDDGFDVVMLNSGMAGMPELTAVLLRTGREFALVTSLFDDPDGRRRVREVIAAAAVRRRLREARVALVGHHFEGMTDLMFDGLSLRQDDRARSSGRSSPRRSPSASARSRRPTSTRSWPSSGRSTRSRWSRRCSSARSASRWRSSR